LAEKNSTSFPDVLPFGYDCWLLSKKEVVRRFFSMSAFYQYSRYLFETGCPNISFWGCLGCL